MRVRISPFTPLNGRLKGTGIPTWLRPRCFSVRIRGRLPINKSSDPREFRVLQVIAAFAVELSRARPLDDGRSSSNRGWDSCKSLKGTGSATGRRANAIHRTVCTERTEGTSHQVELAQLVRATRLDLVGHGFDSHVPSTGLKRHNGKPRGCGSNPPAGDGIAPTAVTPRAARRVGSLRRNDNASRHSTGGAGVRMSSSPGSRLPQRSSSSASESERRLRGRRGSGALVPSVRASSVGVIAPICSRDAKRFRSK